MTRAALVARLARSRSEVIADAAIDAVHAGACFVLARRADAAGDAQAARMFRRDGWLLWARTAGTTERLLTGRGAPRAGAWHWR